MNERIKQLAAKANFGHMENGEVVYDPRLEKFAELIIQECLNQCYNNGMNDSLYEGQLKAASYIEQHFGIKE
jgi:hypothetical protein